MIKLCKSVGFFIITATSIGLAACAGSPDIDTRPALILSAEKSLELGVSNYDDNNFEKAEAHFNRALFLYRNIDNPEGIATSCLNIAKTKLSSGQINEARAYTRQASSIIQHEHLKHFKDRLALIQSSIAIEDSNINEAKQLIDDLLKKTETNSNPAILTAALQNRTRIAFLENNNADDWVKKYENAINKPGQDFPLNQARLLRFKAELNSEKELADKYLSDALTLYRKLAHSPGIAATLTEWAALDLTNVDQQSAANKLERALFIRTNLHDKNNSQQVLQQLAALYKNLGNPNKSDRASYWHKKIGSENFDEWDTIKFEFDNYPG